MPHITRFRCAAAPLLAAAAITSASAQSQTPPQPAAPARFEVASIKRSTAGGIQVLLGSGPGRFRISNVSLQALMQSTFRLQIVNAPGWIETERFDINAKIPDGIQLAPGGEDAMVEALLVERFKLVTHRETREVPAYALVLAAANGKAPRGLVPAPPECAPGGPWSGPGPDGRPKPIQPGQRRGCGLEIGPGTMTSGGMSMGTLARVLSTRLGRVVQDRTGLAGQFEFDLKYTPDQIPNVNGSPASPDVVDPNGPSLATAVREQLGLKLESTRAPVEILVIDSVDRPTPD